MKGEKMLNRNIHKALLVVSVVAIVSFGVNAFADTEVGYGPGSGMGYGRHMGYGPGPDMGYGPGTGRGYGRHMGHGPGAGRGYGRHMGYGPGSGMDRGRGMDFGPGMGKGFRGRGVAPELSAEERKKLDEQRNTFFKATDDLRQKSYSKRLELQSEFAKKNPDTGKAASLQKELSNLKAQIDQKRIGHLIEMQKINPNAGRGFAGRGGRGFMRSGPAFGGPCWR